jgi:hypothetical protein
MEFAENLALDHKFDKDLGHALKESPNNGGFHYFNTKKINVIDDDDDEEISGEMLTMLIYFSFDNDSICNGLIYYCR